MILVVDDSPVIRSLVVAALSHVNLGVREADSGASALRICAQEAIDAVLLDVELRGENGVNVGRRLKSERATAAIPIILMSGHSEDDVDDRQHIADYFLAKPFTLDQVQQVVQQALAHEAAR
ncbi:MAG TPA: response regulator [Herpetosiphonaceae bacterium]|nr:response regulator [Herpetosiphonaceae bacterium]